MYVRGVRDPQACLMWREWKLFKDGIEISSKDHIAQKTIDLKKLEAAQIEKAMIIPTLLSD